MRKTRSEVIGADMRQIENRPKPSAESDPSIAKATRVTADNEVGTQHVPKSEKINLSWN